MTEEIIKKITDAEAQGAELKRAAALKGEQIVADANLKAKRMDENVAEACKTYRETQIKKATEDAETAYAQAIEKTRNDAQAYCEKALYQSEAFVGEIIRRITGGDC